MINLTDEQITASSIYRSIISHQKLRTAVNNLAAGMVQRQVEEVACPHASSLVNVDICQGLKCGRITSAGWIYARSRLVFQSCPLFSGTTASLCDKGLVRHCHFFGFGRWLEHVDAFEGLGKILESDQRSFQQVCHIDLLTLAVHDIAIFISFHALVQALCIRSVVVVVAVVFVIRSFLFVQRCQIHNDVLKAESPGFEIIAIYFLRTSGPNEQGVHLIQGDPLVQCF